MAQLERVEAVLSDLGTLHDAKFARREKEILDGLAVGDASEFEHAQKLLGELLGFDAGKIEAEGSPDPWWIAGGRCIVFEDHSNAKAESSLDVKKARQVASHPNWMKANVEQSIGTEIVSVLVTPVATADQGAVPHLGSFSIWPIREFREWARRRLRWSATFDESL